VKLFKKRDAAPDPEPAAAPVKIEGKGRATPRRTESAAATI